MFQTDHDPLNRPKSMGEDNGIAGALAKALASRAMKIAGGESTYLIDRATVWCWGETNWIIGGWGG